MGIGDWFNTFCTNIQIANAESISTRYKALTKRLNMDF
jgi:hypothetical protein